MSDKKRLLAVTDTAERTVTVFGDTWRARHLTAARLNQHNRDVVAAQKTNDGDQISTLTAQFVLDSLLDGKGQPMANTVTPADLTAVKTAQEITAAMRTLMNFNFMDASAEDAAKNG